ncbi:MAG: hypothetical protein EBT83_16925, partial [Betaproteobacteria bacterium]|nr:hypothetical protein [Betaproteobacteria bacterium]
PHANIVGEVNGGWKARTSDPSQFNDLELAANAVGVCDTSVENATAFAKTQLKGARPLADQQRVQLKLAEMNMLTESLRAYIMRTAWERDLACAGDKVQAASANAGLVMVFSQEIIQRVTALGRAVYAIGGAEHGAMNASADKLERDAFIWTHLAGDSLSRIKTIKKILR